MLRTSWNTRAVTTIMKPVVNSADAAADDDDTTLSSDDSLTHPRIGSRTTTTQQQHMMTTETELPTTTPSDVVARILASSNGDHDLCPCIPISATAIGGGGCSWVSPYRTPQPASSAASDCSVSYCLANRNNNESNSCCDDTDDEDATVLDTHNYCDQDERAIEKEKHRGYDNTERLELAETIAVLHHQECSGGYFLPLLPSISSTSSSAVVAVGDQSVVNDDQHHHRSCRAAMLQWCYSVAEYVHCRFSTIEIAMSYLDRYYYSITAATSASTSVDRTSVICLQEEQSQYQLACMVCLYIAMKLHEPICCDIQTMSAVLAHGFYSIQQMEQKELEILFTLQWKLHPPTTEDFIQTFVAATIPDNFSSQKEAILKLAADQANYAFSKNVSFATTIRASIIAYCSVMNAIEYCDSYCRTQQQQQQQHSKGTIILDTTPVPETTIEWIGYNLARMIGIDDCNDPTIVQLQNKLYRDCLVTSNSNAEATIVPPKVIPTMA